MGATADTLLNRELGLIEFNRRVLAQAEDETLPLLERLKFLCIVSSNLDEFFEVRVAWLKDNVQHNPNRILADGSTPGQALAKVATAARELMRRQYDVLRA
ncbi:MAG: RNA degradosome polyphosphate kinase, partial [Microvirgula sp.]